MLKSSEFYELPGLEATNNSGEAPRFRPLGPALKVLMVWPRFPSSFWSFDGIRDMVPMRTEQPPLGLLTVAALCPKD